MGVALSALSCGCQALSCGLGLASCCFSSAMGGGLSARGAKIAYVGLLGVATLIALFFRYHGDHMNINLGAWEVHCSNSTDESDLSPISWYRGEETYIYCKGDAAVYRISFCLTMFFATMLAGTVEVPTILRDDATGNWRPLLGYGFHRGWWGPKLILFFLALAACFFMPNNVFDNSGFAWVARLASMVFLLLQILVLIDFGYQWNEDWVDRAYEGSGAYGDPENKGWLVAVLVSAATLYILAITGLVVLFVDYSDCTLGHTFSWLTLIGVILMTIGSLFREKLVGEVGAILPAAVVSFYATYLCWSALQSSPDATCRPEHVKDGAGLTIGVVLAAVSLMWTSYSCSTSAQSLITGQDRDASSSPSAQPFYRLEADGERNAVDTIEGEDDDTEPAESREKLWIFHLIMMTASMYMAMLLTNWGVQDSLSGSGNEDGKVGTASMWVKIVSQWLTIGLYVWTLVAPKVLGQYRDFDF